MAAFLLLISILLPMAVMVTAVVQGVLTGSPTILGVLGLSLCLAAAVAAIPVLREDQPVPGFRFAKAPGANGVPTPQDLGLVSLRASGSREGRL